MMLNLIIPDSQRRCVFVWSLVAVTIIVSGCDDKPRNSGPKSVARPYSGQEVELVVPESSNIPAQWEVQIQEWMTQTGASVRWTKYAADDAGALRTLLAGPGTTGGRIVLFPLKDLISLDRFLAPLNTGNLVDFDHKDVLRGLRERVVSRNRTILALPTAVPMLVCYYRADLLRSAGLKPPETWEEYDILVDSRDKWAPNLTAVEPMGQADRTSLFFSRVLAYAKHPENYSVWFDLESGKPTIDTPGFQQATDLAYRAWKRMPPEIMGMTASDCRNEVLGGRAALAIGSEPTSSISPENRRRAEGMEIGVCRLPGSRRVYNRSADRWDAIPATTIHAPGICGRYGQAIGINLPEGSAKRPGAWHLMSLIALEQFESSWSNLEKTPCRESQVGAAVTWHETGLTLEESGQWVDAVTTTLRDAQLTADLPLVSAAEFRTATSNWLEQLVKRDSADSQNAVKDLQVEFERITSSIGQDAIRSEYRIGLGLGKIELPSESDSPKGNEK